MRRFLAIAGLLLAMLCASAPARAQCVNQSPAIFGGGNVFGAIVSQWKQFFAAKIDANNGCANNLTVTGTLSLTYQEVVSALGFVPVGTGNSVPVMLGTSVNNPGTGTLEGLLPVNSPDPLTGNSYSFACADMFKKTRRSNGGVAMTDTLLSSTATCLTSAKSNGVWAHLYNADVSASDTITAGAGTTIAGSATYVLLPGRDIWISYDLANTEWRFDGNTNTALLTSQLGNQVSAAVATNAALQGAAVTAYSLGVWRLSFGNGNGAGPLFYTPSGSACSLNAGAGDNGSQVPSADGKCWLAAFPASGIDVAQFGVIFDNTTDNTTKLQAALTYAATAPVGTKVLINAPAGSSGIACTFSGVTSTGQNLTIEYTGFATALSSCGHNVTTITYAGGTTVVNGGQIYGYGAEPGYLLTETFIGAAAKPAGVLGAHSTDSDFNNTSFSGGANPLQVLVGQATLRNVYATNGYGSANFYVGNNGVSGNIAYMDAWNTDPDQVDEDPIKVFPSVSESTPGNYATATHYNPGTVVSINLTLDSVNASYFIQSYALVTAAVIHSGSAGSGGTTGACTLTVTPSPGTGAYALPALLTGTVSGGALTGSLAVSFGGQYAGPQPTGGPYTSGWQGSESSGITHGSWTNVPVTGCGLTGAAVDLTESLNVSGSTGLTTLAPRGIPILDNNGTSPSPDGTAAWLFNFPNPFYHYQFDGGSFETRLSNSDTGGGSWGVAFTNNSTRAPSILQMNNDNYSGHLGDLTLAIGSDVQISNGKFGGCYYTNCNDIAVSGSFSGNITMSGGYLRNANEGVALSAGNNFAITGVGFSGNTTDVSLSGSVGNAIFDDDPGLTTVTNSSSGTGNLVINSPPYNPVGYTGSTNVGGTSGTTPGVVTNAGLSPEMIHIVQSATDTATVYQGAGTSGANCTGTQIGTLNGYGFTDLLSPGQSDCVKWVTTQPTYTANSE